MKLHYYADTDSLYIELRDVPSVETHEVAEGVLVDLDGEGNVVGFDIDAASRKMDLGKAEVEALPVEPGCVA